MLRLQHTRLPLKHDDKSELVAKQQQRAQARQLHAAAADARGAAAATASDSGTREQQIAATRARLGLA